VCKTISKKKHKKSLNINLFLFNCCFHRFTSKQTYANFIIFHITLRVHKIHKRCGSMENQNNDSNPTANKGFNTNEAIRLIKSVHLDFRKKLGYRCFDELLRHRCTKLEKISVDNCWSHPSDLPTLLLQSPHLKKFEYVTICW